jgi:ABC-2 type transport system ATP-binding protein
MAFANAIVVENLRKEFPGVVAVDDVTFAVEHGEIFGFLGPNGAGKTTAISILCTLLKPTSGRARVNGFDCATESHRVRASVGIVFQDSCLDERLTAEENLNFYAILYGLAKKDRRRRVIEALTLVGLEDRRRDLVRTFSRGMKRRLDIARGLLHIPKVLFLDEPTTGLDLQTRSRIWEDVRRLRDEEGVTVLLTTHYIEEAEICDRVAIIDQGKLVACDTPDQLKAGLDSDVLVVQTIDDERLGPRIGERLQMVVEPTPDGLRISMNRDARNVLRELIDTFSHDITAVYVKRPTLSDVFLKLTGAQIREESRSAADRMRESPRARRMR